MGNEMNFSMRCDGDFIDALDHLRRAEADLPSRAEMMRRLVERAAKTKTARSEDRAAVR